VAAAYKLLRERGLAESRGRSGTFVRPRPALATRSARLPVRAGVIDLASGSPDPRLLPVLQPAALSTLRGSARTPPGLVVPELLDVAGRRLGADGVPAESVTLASGGLDAIGRLLQAHLRTGDVVGVEDPGWPNVLDLVPALGMRVRPVAVDSAGPEPESLHSVLRAGARAVIVTSRAHNPSGAYVTSERAAELRRVLAEFPQTLVIEDDHAAELAGVKLTTLAGSTPAWAFVRSMSKPYGPDLRLATIAADAATVARVEGRMHVGSGWVSTLLQRLAVQLWTSPTAARSVARAAQSYDRRRAQLITQLAQRGIPSTGSTGLNVWIPVPDEATSVAFLLQKGWAVAPGTRFRQASPPGIRVTVGALDEDGIPRFADSLAEALAAPLGGPYTA
jgi:DNA-binding transcriptional MocR family regulator